MPRRKAFPGWFARLTRTSVPSSPRVVEPPAVVRGRAIGVLSEMPARYIATKNVLDAYLDTIGLGR